MNIERLSFEAVEGRSRPADGVAPPLRSRLKASLNYARTWTRKAMAPGGVTGIVMAVVFVVVTDVLLLAMGYFQELPPVALTLIIPIIIAAIRWGALSGAVTAIVGAISVTLFSYNPFYTFNSADRSRVLGVVFFLVVSLVSGYLASRARHEAARAHKREIEIRDLYTFSQRLSAANSPAGIFEAMQQHLGMLVGRKVVLFGPQGTLEAKSEQLSDPDVPRTVSDAVGRMPTADVERSSGLVVDDERGSAWLVKPVSVNTAEFGVVAVDLGRRDETFEDLRSRVVALVADAGLSLERLGVARTLAEVRTRAETEQFREALIGSVSHDLRTPLSSILGAATVLALAPEVAGAPRLKKLAALIHQESDRLNVEIENILDASRISSNGLQPKLEWAEPADFVNAALQRCRNRLAGRTVEVRLPEELVLLHIDSVLMERALGQILDNAAKYSPSDSPIVIHGEREDVQFSIAVTDHGAGLDADDRALLGQKFFRGHRHTQSTTGLGLGFWIASAFVSANNGAIEATSAGINKGMAVTIRLPLAMKEDHAGLI
jgi:two-component system, OmpR family, sensor histidine kinase KdpD